MSVVVVGAPETTGIRGDDRGLVPTAFVATIETYTSVPSVRPVIVHVVAAGEPVIVQVFAADPELIFVNAVKSY